MSAALRMVLSALLFTTLSLAQDVRTATLVGTVTDPSNAAVPNATISVVNVQTGVKTESRTTPNGE